MSDRIQANTWLPVSEMLHEIDNLKWAVAALASLAGSPGSTERENANNAVLGIKRRLDYLHDSLRKHAHE